MSLHIRLESRRTGSTLTSHDIWNNSDDGSAELLNTFSRSVIGQVTHILRYLAHCWILQRRNHKFSKQYRTIRDEVQRNSQQNRPLDREIFKACVVLRDLLKQHQRKFSLLDWCVLKRDRVKGQRIKCSTLSIPLVGCAKHSTSSENRRAIQSCVHCTVTCGGAQCTNSVLHPPSFL